MAISSESRQDFLPFYHKRLINLWQMIHFLHQDSLRAFLQLKHSVDFLFNEKRATPAKVVSKELRASLTSALDLAENVAARLNLKDSQSRIYKGKLKLGFYHTSNVSEVYTYIKDLSDTFGEELVAINFLFIGPEKLAFYEKDNLFGYTVTRSFPDAECEIKSAGNCIALELNTAAVFHLMRVVEIGLRHLAIKMKAKTIIKKLKATKIPIELGTWEEIITTLESRLNELRRNPRGAKRERKIETCNELIKEFRALKDLWRNKVMHARAIYDSKQAESAFDHVRTFMQRLATSKDI